MRALWITLAVLGGLILLGLFLLFFGSFKLRIKCKQKPKVVLSILGIHFTLFSERDPEPDKADLATCRNPDRVLKKELRRQRKEAKKLQKKKQKALKKLEKRKQERALTKQSGQPSPSIRDNLDMIKHLLIRLYELTEGKIKIHVRKFLISVGTENAAKTAILYGVILQSSSWILQFIESHFTHIKRERGSMQVKADYLSDKMHAEIDIVCSVRIYRALRVGLSMLSEYRHERKLALKKARIRAEDKAIAEAKKQKRLEKLKKRNRSASPETENN